MEKVKHQHEKEQSKTHDSRQAYEALDLDTKVSLIQAFISTSLPHPVGGWQVGLLAV